MGSLGSSSASSNTSQSGTQASQTTFNPDPSTMNYWNALMGEATGLVAGQSGVGGLLNTSAYPTASSMVAPTTDTMQNYLNNANAISTVNPYNTMMSAAGPVMKMSGDMYNTQTTMPYYNQSSFVPDQGTLNGIAAWGQQQFGNIPQVGTSFNIPYQNVNAASTQPSLLSGLPQVSAPNVNYYQMNPVQQIGPQQSWTDPGVSQQYMSPYTQNVVNTQLAQAQVQEQQQLQQQNAAATQAGAFGGSRAAVEAANTSIGYQQLAAQLQAQGLQNAYTQGAQQFNTQQALGMQGLLANQNTALQTGTQNLAANLQTQGLATQANMQGQLANQQTALQSGIANQQAQEFTAGQQLQASLANQQAGIQTGITGAQLGMQGQMANQAAAMQAAGLQYQGGVNAAEQQQSLGLQGQLAGAQLGSQNQQATEVMNQQAIAQAAQLQQNAANMNLSGYGAYLQGLGAIGQAGGAAQGLAQMTPDAQLASFLMQSQMPLQGVAALATLAAMRPLPYTMGQAGQFSGTGQTQTTSTPSLLSQLGGIGSFIGSLGFAKGGKVPSGIARYQGGGIYSPEQLNQIEMMQDQMKEYDPLHYQTGGGIASSSSSVPAGTPPWVTATGSGPTLASLADPTGSRLAAAQKMSPQAGDYFQGLENAYGALHLDPQIQQERGQGYGLSNTGQLERVGTLPQAATDYWNTLMNKYGVAPSTTSTGSGPTDSSSTGLASSAGLGQTLAPTTAATGGLAAKGERARLRSARNLHGRDGWM